MKFSKGILAIATLMVGGQAMAEDAAVSAEKKAPIQALLPTAYGKLEMRHVTQRKMDGSDVLEDDVKLMARPVLGATFFDGKMDSSLTWNFFKKADSVRVSRTDVEHYTTFTVVDNDYIGVTPWAYSLFGNGQENWKSTEIGIGLASPATLAIPTAAGTITGIISNDYVAYLHNGSSAPKVGVTNDTGRPNGAFGLSEPAAEGGTPEMEQRDPTTYNDFVYGASLKDIGGVKGLKLSVTSLLETVWEPKYATEIVDNSERVSLDGYKVSKYTLNRFTGSYAINDKLTVANQLRQYIDGFYDAGTKASATRWENRLMLTTTLF